MDKKQKITLRSQFPEFAMDLDRLDNVLDKLREKLDMFEADVASGKFHESFNRFFLSEILKTGDRRLEALTVKDWERILSLNKAYETNAIGQAIEIKIADIKTIEEALMVDGRERSPQEIVTHFQTKRMKSQELNS